MPYRIGSGIPNFPNFRLGRLEGSPCDTLTSISEPSSENALHLYPNPATDAVTIELASPLAQPATLTFYNQLCEKVLENSLPKGQREATVPVAHLPKGLYFLALMENGRVVHMQKVVVQ
jgi:hypothetical protein